MQLPALDLTTAQSISHLKEEYMTWLQRDEWGAPAPKAALQRMALPVSTVFLHHTVTPVSADPKADMRKVTNYAKYIDVPYTVVVHPDGTIFTGRYLNGVPALGAHTGGHNSTSLGIAVIGNYVNDQPSPEAIESVARVIEAFVNQGFVTSYFILKSHDQAPYATACCGTNLRAQITDIYSKTKQFIGGSIPVYTPQPVPQKPQAPTKNYPAYPMLLKKGSKGVFVVQLQQKLRERGWKYDGKKLVVDGDFGSKTEAVIKWYQAEKGLTVDGIVGPITWNSIFKSPVT